MFSYAAAVVLAAATAAAGATTPSPAPARTTTTFPLEEVRPGLKGIGRTVFEGNRMEEFQVEIIGVLENTGPKQNMILARLVGGPLEKTGVIAGMSGSPVYIDGRLLGAVAYGFPFSKETIAGITPIAEMIDVTRTGSPRAPTARFPVRTGAALQAPLDRNALMDALKRPMPAVALSPGALRGSLPGYLTGQSLTPLSVPLVFSGFDPQTFDWAKGVFSGMGFSPVMGTGKAASFPGGPLPDLTPGGPIGVTLIEGDMDLSATGTITHIDGDRVYAFGHPFYNLGPTKFPMKKAYVYSVFPSLYQSWKISSTGETVGTIEQDRIAAIAGKLGATPQMIPVQVNLSTSRGQERTFSFRMVDDELFSPVLVFVALSSVLSSNERAFGTATFTVDARLTLSGGREVRVQDLFTEQQPAMQASALVAAPLAYVMTNDFENVSVEKVVVDVASQETIQSATIERAWIERSGPVRAGSKVPLRVQLRTYRGDAVTQTIQVDVPASAPAGHYSLLVTDGPTLTSVEQREMRQAFVPRDFNQLLKALNGLRHNNRIYARLSRPDDGAVVGGEYMQSLPPSVLAVMGGPDQGPAVVPLRTAAIWNSELATDFAVSGTRVLPLTIER